MRRGERASPARPRVELGGGGRTAARESPSPLLSPRLCDLSSRYTPVHWPPWSTSEPSADPPSSFSNHPRRPTRPRSARLQNFPSPLPRSARSSLACPALLGTHPVQPLSSNPRSRNSPRRRRPQMPKIYKPGKVALVLSGRYAGRKVVVIRQSDEGTKVRLLCLFRVEWDWPSRSARRETAGPNELTPTLLPSPRNLQERPYPHAIVAGVDRYPRKVTKGMGKKRIEKRSKVRRPLPVSSSPPVARERVELTLVLAPSLCPSLRTSPAPAVYDKLLLRHSPTRPHPPHPTMPRIRPPPPLSLPHHPASPPLGQALHQR